MGSRIVVRESSSSLSVGAKGTSLSYYHPTGLEYPPAGSFVSGVYRLPPPHHIPLRWPQVPQHRLAISRNLLHRTLMSRPVRDAADTITRPRSYIRADRC